MSSTNYNDDPAKKESSMERFTFPKEDSPSKPQASDAQRKFKSDSDTDLASPDMRRQWEESGSSNKLKENNERPLLSEHGKKGPVSGAKWPTHDIGDLLGEGGMAAVYLARRRDNNNIVALKILPARLADDPAARKRFEREAKISQSINSEHVIKVWDAGRYGPLCYLEMEFVDGASLGDEIKRRRESGGNPYTPEEVIEIALQTADALLEAGKLQLVHRDLKPGNLMMTKNGQVKLADFGIVKVLGEEAMTMTGTAMGTPTYMSPEQGRGDSVDYRADYYSLGVVLYELLTLKPPFEEATADALIYQHHFVEPKLITEINPACPPDLQAIIFTCLQKFPERRYSDAESLIRDLNLVKGGHPPETAVFKKGRVRTGADEALSKHGGGWRRYWKRVLAGAAVLIMAVGLAVWWLLASRAQAEALRSRLIVLDTPQAIPITAPEEVETLRRLVGEHDVQVARWLSKISKAKELRAELSSVTADALTAKDVAHITKTLAAYEELCGSTEPLVTNWQKKLADANRELREARQALMVLDQQTVLPKAVLESVVQPLATASRLSPVGDPDITRWTDLIAAGNETINTIRAQLAVIDDATMLTAEQQRAARDNLARWSVLMGFADNDGIRWAAKVTAAEQQLANLRQSLAQFDSGNFVPLSVVRGLESEWASFQAMADSDDVDLVRWQQRVKASTERRDVLAKKLSSLNDQSSLRQDEIKTLQNVLDEYVIVNGVDDNSNQWQAIISASRDDIARNQAVLSSLMVKEELTQTEQQLLRKTAAFLISHQALGQEQIEQINERLARDEARVLVLMERLSVLDRVADFDDSLAPLMIEFERLAAADDQNRIPWRMKFDTVTELRRRLSALDEKQAIYETAQSDLQELIGLVGTAPVDVGRWRDKLTAVTTQKKALAGLDLAEPVDSDVPAQLQRLIDLIGDSSPDVQRWQKKLADIATYRGRLSELNDSYILPTTAEADLQALKALIGTEDDFIKRVEERIRILRGPERPAWASDFGRDEYGLYADLKVRRHTQRLRYVPAGTFVIGSPDNEAGRTADEKQVTVTLTRSYWLADSECTQGFWREIKGDNPSYNINHSYPVERVSWSDVQQFFTVMNIRFKKSFNCRLPSEAEWEYAARAGAKDTLPGHTDPSADEIDRIAVHQGTTAESSRTVRGRLPNRLGLYDLLGNVWEWCQDSYAPYPLVPTVDLRSVAGAQRVVRGGSWSDKAALLRVADRHALAPDVASAYVGFRFVIDVEWGNK